MMLWVCYEVDV